MFVPLANRRTRLRRDLALAFGWIVLVVQASPLDVPLVRLAPGERLEDLRSNPRAECCLDAIKTWEDARLAGKLTSADLERLRNVSLQDGWYVPCFDQRGIWTGYSKEGRLSPRQRAILAARRNKKEITLSELEESVDRVIAGPERRSRVMTAKEKEITAYHEAGHALVARMLPDADPVHKISIVARGMALGYTWCY